MTLKTRTPRSMARIELIASSEMIKNMRDRGYDFKRIHAYLVDEGKVTMAYTTFCSYASRMFCKKFSMNFIEHLGHKTEKESKQVHSQKLHSFVIDKHLTLDEMV